MSVLGYDRGGEGEIVQEVKRALTTKDGCMLWEEFLDFFFMKETSGR